MRRRFSLFVLLAAGLLHGDFAASAWKVHREILGSATGLASIKFDRAIYAAASPTFSDLRVLHDGGELPYILEIAADSETLSRRTGMVVDRAIRDGNLELVYDLGQVVPHNRLRIDTERRNFRQRVKIETSEDAKRWAVVRDDAAIFDFTQDGRQISSLDIDYPDSSRRYLRLTIDGWVDPKNVQTASVVQFERRSAARETLAQATPAVESKDKTTIATFDLGLGGLPIDRVEFDIVGKAFDRAAAIETSPDGKAWSSAAGGALVRYERGENLLIAVNDRRDRYWRVRIYNGDDQPLTVRSARFLGLERTLKFEAAGGTSILYYGNTSAFQPVYDLAKRLANATPVQAAVLTLGLEETNPAYRPPLVPSKPWSERQPALLYTVLGLAIAVLGFFAWRLLSSMKTTN